jgi:uncharacterized protein (DUF2126 family)
LKLFLFLDFIFCHFLFSRFDDVSACMRPEGKELKTANEDEKKQLEFRLGFVVSSR